MSLIYRRRRVDTTQAEIVRDLTARGYRVDIIREPVDISVGRPAWGNRFVFLECKSPVGKRNPKARTRAAQPKQNEFCTLYSVPRVTSPSEAHAAVLELTRGWG